jgi:BMFP domain-containing protein YqiC
LKGIPGEDGEKKILEDQQKIQESLANQGITSFSEFDPDPVDVEVVINDQGNIMILKVREQQGYDVVYRQEFEFQRVN